MGRHLDQLQLCRSLSQEGTRVIVPRAHLEAHIALMHVGYPMIISQTPARDSMWSHGFRRDEDAIVGERHSAHVDEQLFDEHLGGMFIPSDSTSSISAILHCAPSQFIAVNQKQSKSNRFHQIHCYAISLSGIRIQCHSKRLSSLPDK
jgi:hypothetical protein